MLRNIMTKLTVLPAVMIFYFAMLPCVLPGIHGVQVIFGMPQDLAGNEVDIVVFGKWILMMSVPILANGAFLERSSRVELFSRLRMRRRTDFRLSLASVCSVQAGLWSLLPAVAAGFTEDIMIGLRLFFLLFSNCFLWGIMQLACYCHLKRAAWTGGLLIGMIGGTCLLGLRIPAVSSCMPAMWGMLCRASSVREYIFMICKSLLFALIISLTLLVGGEE